jgi:hypothetical protein
MGNRQLANQVYQHLYNNPGIDLPELADRIGVSCSDISLEIIEAAVENLAGSSRIATEHKFYAGWGNSFSC